jgi:hypothetical protein
MFFNVPKSPAAAAADDEAGALDEELPALPAPTSVSLAERPQPVPTSSNAVAEAAASTRPDCRKRFRRMPAVMAVLIKTCDLRWPVRLWSATRQHVRKAAPATGARTSGPPDPIKQAFVQQGSSAH